MPRLERGIEGLDAALVGRVVERLHTQEPEATALLLTGSYAKGTAAEASDLDLTAITPSPRVGYRTWFEEQIGEPPLRISAGATTAQVWLAKATIPARWSFRFPAISAAAYLCTDEGTRNTSATIPHCAIRRRGQSSRTSSISC